MPLPTQALHAVVAVLRQKLKIDEKLIRAHDGNLGNADGSGLVELPAPFSVLVFSSGGSLEPGYTPPLSNVVYTALVVARLPDQANARRSPGEVAMDIAWSIAAFAENETWEKTHYKTPTDIRPRNEQTAGFQRKGISVWSTTWRQQLELPGTEVVGDGVDSLTSILFRFYGKDEERDPETHAGVTPHHEALVRLDGADPETAGQEETP
jgi:hypothetical protein